MYNLAKAYKTFQNPLGGGGGGGGGGNTPFLQVSQIFQIRKSDANKQDFEMKLNLRRLSSINPQKQ